MFRQGVVQQNTNMKDKPSHCSISVDLDFESSESSDPRIDLGACVPFLGYRQEEQGMTAGQDGITPKFEDNSYDSITDDSD